MYFSSVSLSALVYLCVMIQRPQTLFFLALLAICSMMLFADLAYFETSGEIKGEVVTVSAQFNQTVMSTSSEKTTESNTMLFYSLIVVGILGLASIITFKNRKLQASLTAFNFIGIILVIIMMYSYSYGIDYFEEPQSSSFTAYAFFPLAMIFLNFLGLRGIRKDVQLIRSMDRLR